MWFVSLSMMFDVYFIHSLFLLIIEESKRKDSLLIYCIFFTRDKEEFLPLVATKMPHTYCSSDDDHKRVANVHIYGFI